MIKAFHSIFVNLFTHFPPILIIRNLLAIFLSSSSYLQTVFQPSKKIFLTVLNSIFQSVQQSFKSRIVFLASLLLSFNHITKRLHSFTKRNRIKFHQNCVEPCFLLMQQDPEPVRFGYDPHSQVHLKTKMVSLIM